MKFATLPFIAVFALSAQQFPIGSYELPKSAEGLRAMSAAGFNLVHCHSRADLDRVQEVGMKCVVPVPLELNAGGGKLRAMVEELKDHPALAVWEGPDEIVWNFTAFSGLHRDGTYPTPDEWWRQTPLAVGFARQKAATIIPGLINGANLIRELDRNRHPIWINEAARSDLGFIRQYLDAIDITGCDIYPIHAATRRPWMVSESTQRYIKVGKGRNVWMVLQGFAWGKLPGRNEAITFPTFDETRMMAWSAISRGAKGVLYWGMDAAPITDEYRLSLHAMASELAAVQSFLTAPPMTNKPEVNIIDSEDADKPSRGVSSFIRQVNGETLVVLVNEDDRPHMGIEVTGLASAKSLVELYGTETVEVKGGEFVTRLQPYQVKVFASSRKYERAIPGREFTNK